MFADDKILYYLFGINLTNPGSELAICRRYIYISYQICNRMLWSIRILIQVVITFYFNFTVVFSTQQIPGAAVWEIENQPHGW